MLAPVLDCSALALSALRPFHPWRLACGLQWPSDWSLRPSPPPPQQQVDTLLTASADAGLAAGSVEVPPAPIAPAFFSQRDAMIRCACQSLALSSLIVLLLDGGSDRR
jgi:hypothetical protein